LNGERVASFADKDREFRRYTGIIPMSPCLSAAYRQTGTACAQGLFMRLTGEGNKSREDHIALMSLLMRGPPLVYQLCSASREDDN